MDFKKTIYDSINDENLKAMVDLNSLITFTADSGKGDLTLPCFSLAKILHKSPKDIADDILGKVQSPMIERVENVNGYLNFFLNKRHIFEIVKNEQKSGSCPNTGAGKTMFIDFCSVNLAKYMHIGHLSTTVIGSVISNIYEYLGWKVFRLNYVGDYGTPFGKMITAILRWGDENDIEKKGVDYIQDLYVRFNTEEENDESLMEDARKWSLKIENKDPDALRIYNKIIKVSVGEAKRLCDELKIYFDSWIGEAFYNDKLGDVVDELDSKKLLTVSQGAKVVDLSSYDLGVCMIQKSDGGSLYATRDLATAIDRYDRYRFDLGLYVTSVQQKLHFDRWFKVLGLMGKDYAQNLKHVAYGTYSLPSGKIGSRFGKSALVRDMISISTEKAREIITSRGTKVDNIEELATSIGIGAVKFGVLKTERIKDCVFDLENSLNFDGETSPYIQYTHARCCSIIGKAIGESIDNLDDIDNPDAFEIVKHINAFDKMVIDASIDFEPCYISRYLITLCSLFNKFYNTYRIIDSGKISGCRLEIVKMVKATTEKGLKLLGIDAPDSM